MKFFIDYFQGEFKNDLREGKGIFTYKNGDYYDVHIYIILGRMVK